MDDVLPLNSPKQLRLGISIFFFLHGLSFSTWASRIPEVQAQLGLSESGLGSVLLALPLGSILSMPIAARLASKFGSRRILLSSILINALILVGLSYAQSSSQLIITLFCYGFFGNLANISVNTQGVYSEQIFKRPIMASFHGLWSVAGFVGALTSIIVMSLNLSLTIHFLIISGAIILSGVKVYPFLMDDLSSEKSGVVKKFHFNRNLLVLGLICFCTMLCEGTMFDWSGVYFVKIVGASGPWTVLGYVSFMTTMAGFRFLADRLKEKWGLKQILQMCGLVIFSGLMISIAVPNLFFSTLGFFLVGAGVSAVVPFVLSEAGKYEANDPSRAIAIVSTIGFLGFLVGPPMIGWIAGWTHLRVSFAVVSLLGLCMTGMARSLSSSEGHSGKDLTVPAPLSR